jgi:hypothetical protein
MYLRLSVLLSVISILSSNVLGQKVNDFPSFKNSQFLINDSVLCATLKDLKEGVYILSPNEDTSKILKSLKENKAKFSDNNVFIDYVLFERYEDPSIDHKLVVFNDSLSLSTLEILIIANDPSLVIRSLKKNNLYVSSIEQAINLSSVYRIILNPSMCPPTGIFGKVGMCLDFAKEVFHPNYTDQEKLNLLIKQNQLMADRILKLETELEDLKSNIINKNASNDIIPKPKKPK